MIRLPWTTATGPHLVLEITGRCNLSCRACYKRKDDSFRSLEEIEQDLNTALRLRRVQTVSLAGAEPTLHPQLPAIVNAIHRSGLRVSLVSNGLLLSDALLAELKRAGLDVVMLHVDEGQTRPDLTGSIQDLRRTLANRVVAHGIDAGLSVTLYPETFDALTGLVHLILTTPSLSFAFITHHVDVTRFEAKGRTANADVVGLLRAEYDLEPFAVAGPYPAWLSYFVPVVSRGDNAEFVPLRSGWLDAALIRLPRLLTGRHLFYCPQQRGITRFQTVANLLSRGQWRRARQFVAQSRGARLFSKRLVFDDGRGDCRAFCPNPTIRNGQLVPVCVADLEAAA